MEREVKEQNDRLKAEHEAQMALKAQVEAQKEAQKVKMREQEEAEKEGKVKAKSKSKTNENEKSTTGKGKGKGRPLSTSSTSPAAAVAEAEAEAEALFEADSGTRKSKRASLMAKTNSLLLLQRQEEEQTLLEALKPLPETWNNPKAPRRAGARDGAGRATTQRARVDGLKRSVYDLDHNHDIDTSDEDEDEDDNDLTGNGRNSKQIPSMPGLALLGTGTGTGTKTGTKTGSSIGTGTIAAPFLLTTSSEELMEEDICVLCESAWPPVLLLQDATVGTSGTSGMKGTSGMTMKGGRVREETIVICDDCGGSFHMVCASLYEVPEGTCVCMSMCLCVYVSMCQCIWMAFSLSYLRTPLN